MDHNEQYEILRAEVIKRGADPSNIQEEITRLVALIKKERGKGDGRNLLDLSVCQGYARYTGQPA